MKIIIFTLFLVAAGKVKQVHKSFIRVDLISSRGYKVCLLIGVRLPALRSSVDKRGANIVVGEQIFMTQ